MLTWLKRLYYRQKPESKLLFRSAFLLYPADAARRTEVLERQDGLVFLVEQEKVGENSFRPRPDSKMIGPYEDLQSAESAAVSRLWFSTGHD